MPHRPAEPALHSLPASVRTGALDRDLGSAAPRLTRIALALGAPVQDVPDLVQDTLLAAHRARGSFDPDRGGLEAWLATILVRRVRNARRGERRRNALRALLLAGHRREPCATRELDRVEARLTLERLVSGLSDSQREVVALYEIGELSAEEVGEALGLSSAGVRSIARDARHKLSAAAASRSRSQEARER